MSGLKGSRNSPLPLTLREPNDLPWKPRVVEMMPSVWFGFLRRAHSLAIFIAPSLASVPELQKKE